MVNVDATPLDAAGANPLAVRLCARRIVVRESFVIAGGWTLEMSVVRNG